MRLILVAFFCGILYIAKNTVYYVKHIIMVFEFDLDKCLHSKNILAAIDAAQVIYKNHFSYPRYIGDCTLLCRLHLPVSYEDFYQKYLNYALANSSKPIELRGLTYDELLSESHRFKELVEEQTSIVNDISVYYYGLVCHIIVETFNGKKKELQLLNYIQKTFGYECVPFDSTIDCRFGVDLKITDLEGNIYALQIKPDTFFLGNKNVSLQDDRIGMIHKRNKLRKQFGIDTIYAVYCNRNDSNNGGWYMKDNGKITFKLEQLLQFDQDADYSIFNDLTNEEKIAMRKTVEPQKLPNRFLSLVIK